MEESLRDMLRHGRKFERMRIDDAGIFVRKIPKSKDNPAYLAVEINPIDKSGFPVKKIGVLIESMSELNSIREILAMKEVDETLQRIEKLKS